MKVGGMRVIIFALVLGQATAIAQPTGSPSRTKVAGPLSPPTPRHPLCTSTMTWFLEPSLFVGQSNANSGESRNVTDFVVRNSGGVILRPCSAVAFRLGFALSAYEGIRNLSGDQHWEGSPIGGFLVGPEVEADLYRVGNWRIGVIGSIELGGRGPALREEQEAGVSGKLELVTRLGARVRYRGASVGFDVVHSNGASNLCSGECLGDPLNSMTEREPNTAIMFGIGGSGRPPWVAIAIESVVLLAAAILTPGRE